MERSESILKKNEGKRILNFIIIGNVIMLIGSIAMVLSGFCNTRKKTILMQTVQMVIMALGSLCLGSFTGATMNIFSAVRNGLSYKNKLNTSSKIVLIAVSSSLALYVNNIGIIGTIPIIVFWMYALFMNAENVVHHKILAIIGCSLFTIHDMYICSYTSCVFNIFTVLSNSIMLTQMYLKQKPSKETKKVAV